MEEKVTRLVEWLNGTGPDIDGGESIMASRAKAISSILAMVNVHTEFNMLFLEIERMVLDCKRSIALTRDDRVAANSICITILTCNKTLSYMKEME